VEVGAADAAEPRTDADLVRPQIGRSRDPVDAHVVSPMQSRGQHQIAVIPPSAAHTAPVT